MEVRIQGELESVESRIATDR